jgi:phosphohistidine phosphatase SixA
MTPSTLHPGDLRRTRRALAVGLVLAMAAPWLAAQAGAATESDAWSRVQPGSIVLFRHALAPGTGDPPGFRLDQCSTQRNLNDEGRTQSRRIGDAFRARNIRVDAVSSQWCRTRDTADLAFPGRRVDQPAFNSFFGKPDDAPEQTRAARQLLATWKGPGVLVVTTHQVNITALTGVVPASGEGIVVKHSDGQLQVLGRLTP